MKNIAIVLLIGILFLSACSLEKKNITMENTSNIENEISITQQNTTNASNINEQKQFRLEHPCLFTIIIIASVIIGVTIFMIFISFFLNNTSEKSMRMFREKIDVFLDLLRK